MQSPTHVSVTEGAEQSTQQGGQASDEDANHQRKSTIERAAD
jgi:hypothetical protein